ncbi:MAG: glutathione S-transferase family protein [Pseudomonadota bacterium]|nr:glutathione S-transferase family protein [Pseudomonadota bacterium]
MSRYQLVIGNKNYSSWSMRPWIAMRHFGFDFEETVIQLDQPATSRRIGRHSRAGRVPVLHDGKITVWESLAILEYLGEINPRMWPRNRAARAMARAAANEMHAGFAALRNSLPMNLRRVRRPLSTPLAADVKADISRIEQLWRDCREAHGKGGPFLFGRFTIADAMYAPVVTRFDTYAVDVGKATRAYMDAVAATKALTAWKQSALQESWIIHADEVA